MPTIIVGDLVAALQNYPPDTELTFEYAEESAIYSSKYFYVQKWESVENEDIFVTLVIHN